MPKPPLVDIHCHVVPGVDDGAADDEQAMAMLAAAEADGTAEIVATAHANIQYTFDLAVTKQKVGDLQRRAGDRIRLSYGCEMHLSPANVLDAVRHPAKYAINGYQYILVEMSDYSAPATMLPALEELQRAGLRPIVAHPERNVVIQSRRDMIKPLVAAGILMQVTASAVAGRTTRGLIEAGYVHVVASDAHDTLRRRPGLGDAYRWIQSRFSESLAHLLLCANPAAIASGGEVKAAR